MCLKIGFSEFSKSVRSKGLFRGCKSPGEGEDVGGCYNGLGVEVGVEVGVVSYSDSATPGYKTDSLTS